LVALLAGHGALGRPRPVLLLACDLPLIEPPLLRLLVEWPGSGTVIPVVDGRYQYACARYGGSAFEAAPGVLRNGHGSLHAIAGSDCEYLTRSQWGDVTDARSFTDVDTPDDLERLGL
jgi:molybdopterin-guanine dinucleotide biosynthesis protein A